MISHALVALLVFAGSKQVKPAALAASEFTLEPQLGHAAGISSLSIDPEGTHVLTASNDGTLRLWEIASGKQVRQYATNERSADGTTGGFSFDGKFIYMFRPSNFTWVFDRATGAKVGEFHSTTRFAATTKDYVATGNLSVLLFPAKDPRGFTGVNPNPYSGEPSMPVYAKIKLDEDHKAGHTKTASFADGNRKLVMLADTKLISWDVSQKKYMAVVDSAGLNTHVLSVRPKASELVTVAGKTLQVRDVAKLQVARSAQSPDVISCASYTPDGTAIFTCEGKTGTMRDATSLAILRTFAFANGNPSEVVSDGKRVVFSVGRALSVFTVASGELLHHIAPEALAMDKLAFSQKGRRLLATSEGGASVSVWNLDEARREAHVTLMPGARTFFADAAGDRLTGVDAKGFYTAQVSTGSVQYTSTHKEPPSCVDYRNGKWLSCTKAGCSVRNTTDDTTIALPAFPVEKYASLTCPRWLDDNTVTHQHRGTKPGDVLVSYDTKSGQARELSQIQSVNSSNIDENAHIYTENATWTVCKAPGCKTVQMERPDGSPIYYFVTPTVSPDDKWLASGGDIAGTVFVHSKAGGLPVFELTGHAVPRATLAFSADSRWLASAAGDGGIWLWDMRDGKLAARLFDGRAQWLLVTPAGYFDASQYGGGFVGMVRGDNAYAIDQFALRNNRPDLILERLASPRREIQDHYKRKFLRRLEKAGLDEASLRTLPNSVPQTSLTAKKDGDAVRLEVSCTDAGAALRSYNVFANGVPLLGLRGKPATGRSFKVEERVVLENGANKLEASCTNERGLEAFRAAVDVVHTDNAVGTLYYLGFGVSQYANPSLTLSFAHKDATDVGAALGTFSQRFSAVKVQTFTDAEVTPEKVRASKAFVAESKPSDTVVVFIAGHGMHAAGADATYYYLTHAADPARLAETAADFETIEALLQDIGARRKLLLMDTCESGEAEPDVVAVTELVGKKARARSVRGVQVKKAAAAPARRGYLLDTDRFIYSDVFRRSGAIVLSSSRGGELSYEGEQWNNGAFTFALKQALANDAADLNKDGRLSAPELKAYVSRVVAEATSDAQHPTIDRDNTASKFVF